jgi:pyruvate formate lyase activating enzyme
LVYGALCSANVDPIEKKPWFHYLPGTTALSVATAGCNMECKFCQNWRISQFRPEQVPSTEVTPPKLVELCKQCGSPTIAYTYSEPVVFYEYMHDSAKLARAAGIGSVAISNGYILSQPLRDLCTVLTAIKVDLKAFTEKFYAQMCSARLAPMLEALEHIRATGIWMELVILIVPTLNDSPDEIRQMSQWVVKQLGPDVPMHFTRFHPTYRVMNLPDTPVDTLQQCRQVALDCGVKFAYCGNLRGHPGENTYCPSCSQTLIQRVGYYVARNEIKDGRCPKCQTTIPGIWSQEQALHQAITPTSSSPA